VALAVWTCNLRVAGVHACNVWLRSKKGELSGSLFFLAYSRAVKSIELTPALGHCSAHAQPGHDRPRRRSFRPQARGAGLPAGGSAGRGIPGLGKPRHTIERRAGIRMFQAVIVFGVATVVFAVW
jgi:hypothetical protein